MSTVLRQKFIDHMTVRRLSQRTQASYTNAVAGLAAYYRKAPDTLNDDQIQAYLLVPDQGAASGLEFVQRGLLRFALFLR